MPATPTATRSITVLVDTVIDQEALATARRTIAQLRTELDELISIADDAKADLVATGATEHRVARLEEALKDLLDIVDRSNTGELFDQSIWHDRADRARTALGTHR